MNHRHAPPGCCCFLYSEWFNKEEAAALRRKDLFILLGITALAVMLFSFSRFLPKAVVVPAGGRYGPVNDQTAVQSDVPAPGPGSAGSDLSDSDQPPDGQEAENAQPNNVFPGAPHALEQADAYLSVQIGQTVYDPVPLLSANELEILQQDGKRNVVAFTPESIVMKEANCDNQDCVHQGEVTFLNQGRRVLNNMIICLPNQVVLSLLSPEEAQNQWDLLYIGTSPAIR